EQQREDGEGWRGAARDRSGGERERQPAGEQGTRGELDRQRERERDEREAELEGDDAVRRPAEPRDRGDRELRAREGAQAEEQGVAGQRRGGVRAEQEGAEPVEEREQAARARGGVGPDQEGGGEQREVDRDERDTQRRTDRGVAERKGCVGRVDRSHGGQ